MVLSKGDGVYGDSSSVQEVLDEYVFSLDGLNVSIKIFRKEGEPVPIYFINLFDIGPTTELLLRKLRDEFVSRVDVGSIKLDSAEATSDIKEQFKVEIRSLINKYLSNVDEKTTETLITHLIRRNIGLGDLELLLKDETLEEIVINSAKDPVWVYHRKHGWLKTNISMESEDKIRHYASIIGRDVGKEITILNPLMDAHLTQGDRVNATLNPISDRGNTLTIRKFAQKPWSIVDMINNGTMSVEVAAWVWLIIQNELSLIVSGGTGSGKTSVLNAISNFFPPNQRIISIEDTRELTLPKTLHWVPLETRLPNPEGKGGVSMLDLVVNSLRMRPDKIIMGEIRRSSEAEVLFEALHTGHAVYGTLHANDAHETIVRLTNPPIDIAKEVVSSLNLVLVQKRNRRTGDRKSFQFAEITRETEPNVLIQYSETDRVFGHVGVPKRTVETIHLFTGLTPDEIKEDLVEKIKILNWLIDEDINDVDEIGLIMSKYYSNNLVI